MMRPPVGSANLVDDAEYGGRVPPRFGQFDRTWSARTGTRTALRRVADRHSADPRIANSLSRGGNEDVRNDHSAHPRSDPEPPTAEQPAGRGVRQLACPAG